MEGKPFNTQINPKIQWPLDNRMSVGSISDLYNNIAPEVRYDNMRVFVEDIQSAYYYVLWYSSDEYTDNNNWISEEDYFWSMSKGEVISYGILQLANWTVTPTTTSEFLWINIKRASHIINQGTWQFETEYTNCFMKITEWSPTPTEWVNMRFTDIASLYTRLQTVASTSWGVYDYDISLEVYDIIDPSIPSIAKIHWQNMFFSMIKGRKNYKKTMSIVNETNEWSELTFWYQDIIQNLWFSWYSYVPWDWGNGIIRLPANYRKMYGLLRWDATVFNRTGSSRNTTDGTSIVTNVSWPTGDFSVDHNNSRYCSVPMNWGSYWFYNKDQITQYIDELNFTSTVMCYKVTNWNNHAAYIKPVGIDMLTIPYFDQSKYDLYGYMHGRNQFSQLKHITWYTTSWPYSDSIRITKELWNPLKYRVQSTRWYWEDLSMRLVLKDKITWKISPLSKARIVWRSGRDKPVAADVRY